MDKLQPIIKQRFWILLGLCLILALFGFFKNQSEIVAATTAREEALKQTLSGIPAGTEPNSHYVEQLKAINQAYDAKINAAIDELFASQQSRMTWPPQIARDIPRDPKGVPLYRDKEKKLSTVATRTYSTIYKNLIEEVWKKAEPVVEREVPNVAAPGGVGPNRSSSDMLRGINQGVLRPRGNQRTSKFLTGQTILYGHQGHPPLTWAQKCYIDRQAVPQKVLAQIPSPDQVWDCQEDIWFTELLFDAVRKVNKDAENVLSSPVRVISKVELRGGIGVSAGGGDGMMDGMMDGMEGMDGMDGMAMGGMNMGGMNMGMAGPGGMLPPPPTEFDPAEVFGPDVSMAMGGGMGEDAMGEDGMDGGMGMGMGMMGPPASLRWVGPTDGVPFRERGFYLSVIINQQRIPDFLVYLCEGAWPTKIERFQMGPNPYRKTAGGAAGMAGMGYGMGMEGSGYDPMGGGGGAYSGGGIGGMGMGGGFGGFGGAFGEGAGMGMDGMMGFSSAANRYPGGPPAFTGTIRDPFAGSLNNPDLVQLDIAGIITFYVSSEAAAELGETPALDTPSAPGGEAELLKEAAVEAAEAARAQAEGTTPAPAAGDVEPTTPTEPQAAPTEPAAAPPADDAAPPAAPAATDQPAPADPAPET